MFPVVGPGPGLPSPSEYVTTTARAPAAMSRAYGTPSAGSSGMAVGFPPGRSNVAAPSSSVHGPSPGHDEPAARMAPSTGVSSSWDSGGPANSGTAVQPADVRRHSSPPPALYMWAGF